MIIGSTASYSIALSALSESMDVAALKMAVKMTENNPTIHLYDFHYIYHLKMFLTDVWSDFCEADVVCFHGAVLSYMDSIYFSND